MTVLVVHAHPLEESFNCAVFDTVLHLVRSHEPGADVVDLQRRTPASVSAAADPDAIVDTAVLVYPTWWTAQPALLWQWLLDRLASHLAPSCETLPTIGSRCAGFRSTASALRTRVTENECFAKSSRKCRKC